MDECYENPKICLNGRCINTAGSYRCECQPGFTPTSDGGFCVDINECDAESSLCDNGRCINTDGSFRCVCNAGYHLAADKKSCIGEYLDHFPRDSVARWQDYVMRFFSSDIDECSTSICQNGRCLNTVGSFHCECSPGFELGSDGRSCLGKLEWYNRARRHVKDVTLYLSQLALFLCV